MKRLPYADAEKKCEASFLGHGDWWHLYTPGNLTELLFRDDDDYRYVMNLMARCLAEVPGLAVVAFEVMSNHLHIVLCGSEVGTRLFFELFRKRLSRYMATRYESALSARFQMSLKPVPDLKALRNTIVYVNRNGYVVTPECTPFSYPWGTGPYYFCRFLPDARLSDLKDRAARRMFKGRNPHLPGDYLVINGHIAPPSYCDIRLGMAMFRDAHHYFWMVSKDVEAYEEIAKDLDDGEFLTDNELFTQLWKYVRSAYDISSLKELSQAQKIDLAKRLRYDYRSSNGQIRRVLGLSQYEVDSLFPLGAHAPQ